MTQIDGFSLVWSFLKGFWPFILIVLVAKGIPVALEIWRMRRLAAAGIDDIDKMDGFTFECCLEVLFVRKGYRVERTPYVGDWGADLVLGKDGVRTVVQAKRYSKKVGVRAVQEAVAAKAKYRCTKAMVVTNSTFTHQAAELAHVNEVVLWDRGKLVNELLRHPATTSQTTASQTTASTSTSTLAWESGQSAAGASSDTSSGTCCCAYCGKPISDKVARYCADNAAQFAGQMYCYEHQKSRYRRAA